VPNSSLTSAWQLKKSGRLVGRQCQCSYNEYADLAVCSVWVCLRLNLQSAFNLKHNFLNPTGTFLKKRCNTNAPFTTKATTWLPAQSQCRWPL